MPSKFFSTDALLNAMGSSGLPTALRDRGLLESAVAAPQAGFGGHDPYPSLYLKAAVLMRAIILNHPFVDGNKRAGLFAGLLFLRSNYIDFDGPDDLVYEEVIAIACGQRSIEQIADFLQRYSLPLAN